MKKLYIHTIIGYSGWNCVFIILFTLYGSTGGLYKSNLFWLRQYDPLNLHIGRRAKIQY